MSSPIPWYRYALIVDLASRLNGISPQFGKTALQKMIYILQEAYQVNVGYDYVLYNYGPYSEELSADAVFVHSMGGVHISWVAPGGYRISTGPRWQFIRDKGITFLNQHANSIDQLVNEFGAMPTRQLELLSTLIFVERDSRGRGDMVSSDALANIVAQIKPKYTNTEISAAIKLLAQRGIISLSRPAACS